MPSCPIEQAVNARLKDVFAEAEQLLFSRFAGVTLADIADDFPPVSPTDATEGERRCG